MCATCVGQGVVYVGGALTGLRVMGARAKARRLARQGEGAGDRLVASTEAAPADIGPEPERRPGARGPVAAAPR